MSGTTRISTRSKRAKQKAPPSREVTVFLEMLMAERGAAVNTVAAYQRDLSDFGLFMHRRGRKIEDAEPVNIQHYMSHLRIAGRAPTTRARHLSVLRQFYAFLYSEGKSNQDPTQRIDSPKLGHSLPKYLGEEEVNQLLVAARGRSGRTSRSC